MSFGKLALNADFTLRLNEPNQCGAIHFFQLSIILHHVQPLVYGLFFFPPGRQQFAKYLTPLLLCGSLYFIAIQELDTQVFRDASHDLIPVSGLHQPVQFRQPLHVTFTP